MNYKSPITLIQDRIQFSMDEQILKAVQNVGIDVDKSELIKALQYDREQYRKGYEDGYEDGKAINEWIPVSERLPEDGLECEYLLTWRDRFADEPWEYHIDCCLYKAHPVKSIFVLNGRREFYWDFYEGQECEPVAWMPLPEPYVGDDNE